jgi:uroporphyrinogen decarboxylase
MNSRERVFTTLRHEEPDMVPFNMRVCGEILEQLRILTSDPEVDWYTHFGHDIRPEDGFALPACPEGVALWEWTPMPTEAEQTRASDRISQHKASGQVVCSGYQMGIFEHAKEWFGDVDTLLMPYTEPERFELMLDRIMQWKMAVYGLWVQLGVDVVWIGDDLGTQRSLVMSPGDYHQWYEPRHRELIGHLKRLNPQVYVAFHSCGHIAPLIPDLIDLGVDILEAVQAETMDIAQLKREFGKDITFWGGVGAQSVLARKDRGEVIEGVRQTLEIMKPGGGYIASPCHTLTEEVSWDNILAYHEAIQLYRHYDKTV